MIANDHQSLLKGDITHFVLISGSFSVGPAALRPSIGMTSGPLLFTQVLVNKQPSFSAGSLIIWAEGGVPYDRPWAVFSRGKWQGLDAADELDQNVTFIVTTHPESLFERSGLPSIKPCAGVSCKLANLTFTAKTKMVGKARIDVVIKDSGGINHGGQDTSSVSSFYIHIRDVLEAPTFSMPSVLDLVEDAGMYELVHVATAISAGSMGEWDQTVTFQVLVLEPYMFRHLPTVSGDGTLRLQTAPNVNGNTTVSIQLLD